MADSENRNPRADSIVLWMWWVGVFLTVFPAAVSLTVNMGQESSDTTVALVRDLLFAASAIAGVAIAEATGGFFLFLDQGRRAECRAAFGSIMFLLLLLIICLSIFGLVVSKNPLFVSRIPLTIVGTLVLLALISYLSFTL